MIKFWSSIFAESALLNWCSHTHHSSHGTYACALAALRFLAASWQTAPTKDLALLRRRFSSMLQRKMIGAPDVLMSKDSARTQRTLQLAGGKENICTSANKSLAAIRTPEKALSESMQQVPRIALHIADRLSSSSGKLLIVEGNIGVGKTTLTQKIARELNYKLFLEPATENPFLGKEFLSLYHVAV